MHNLKRPFFAQYDMPEKYDLARKIFLAVKYFKLVLIPFFRRSIQNTQCTHPNG
jgi:hypothetical protein